MFFTREDIEKIHQGLLRLGIKDSELPETINVNSDDTLTIVQDGKNKKINIEEFFNNISLFKKEGFINITDRFNKHSISLIKAIQTVPTHQRIDGLVITFEDINGDWRIYQFRGNSNEFTNENKWLDLYDYTNYIVKSITPDEEDLTVSKPDKNGNAIVSLKDRVYDESNFSGKGYKILRKNIQTIDGVRKNILTQNMINKPNTIYVIRYDFDLFAKNEELNIPYINTYINTGIDRIIYYPEPFTIQVNEDNTNRKIFSYGNGCLLNEAKTETYEFGKIFDKDEIVYAAYREEYPQSALTQQKTGTSDYSEDTIVISGVTYYLASGVDVKEGFTITVPYGYVMINSSKTEVLTSGTNVSYTPLEDTIIYIAKEDAFTSAEYSIKKTIEYSLPYDKRIENGPYYYGNFVVKVLAGFTINIPVNWVVTNDEVTTIIKRWSSQDAQYTPSEDTDIQFGKWNTVLPQTKFMIQSCYVLPDNCVLKFEGGSINKGVIIGNNTSIIIPSLEKICDLNITFKGTWKSGVAYPIQFGATGDGVTNDTKAFQNALAVSNHIYTHKGIYIVDGAHQNAFKYVTDDCFNGIRISKSNVIMEFEDGTILKKTGADYQHRNAILISPQRAGIDPDIYNIQVVGGEFVGNRQDYIGTSYQYEENSTGILCGYSHNVVIENTYCHDFQGDSYGSYDSSNVLWKNVKSSKSRRTGYAVGSTERLTMTGCVSERDGSSVTYESGVSTSTLPACGITLEADGKEPIKANNIIIENCKIDVSGSGAGIIVGSGVGVGKTDIIHNEFICKDNDFVGESIIILSVGSKCDDDIVIAENYTTFTNKPGNNVNSFIYSLTGNINNLIIRDNFVSTLPLFVQASKDPINPLQVDRVKKLIISGNSSESNIFDSYIILSDFDPDESIVEIRNNKSNTTLVNVTCYRIENGQYIAYKPFKKLIIENNIVKNGYVLLVNAGILQSVDIINNSVYNHAIVNYRASTPVVTESMKIKGNTIYGVGVSDGFPLNNVIIEDNIIDGSSIEYDTSLTNKTPIISDLYKVKNLVFRNNYVKSKGILFFNHNTNIEEDCYIVVENNIIELLNPKSYIGNYIPAIIKNNIIDKKSGTNVVFGGSLSQGKLIVADNVYKGVETGLVPTETTEPNIINERNIVY